MQSSIYEENMRDREQHIIHQPEEENGEQKRELEWIEQHRDIFWLTSFAASQQLGFGTLIIDTTNQLPEGGHPIGYLVWDENKNPDVITQNSRQTYDPNTEYLVTLLKPEGHVSTYKDEAPSIGWRMATKTTLTEQQPDKKTEIPEALFDLGQIAITIGAAEEAQNIRRHPSQLIARHVEGEWGDLPPEDIEENDYALQRGTRIFSAYNIEGSKFYVITEWDRSVTTVLQPSEY